MSTRVVKMAEETEGRDRTAPSLKDEHEGSEKAEIISRIN